MSHLAKWKTWLPLVLLAVWMVSASTTAQAQTTATGPRWVLLYEIDVAAAVDKSLEADDIVEQTVETVRRRAGSLAVLSGSTIEREGKSRMLVSVAGFRDPDVLKRLIGSQAKLTFQFVDASVPDPAKEAPTDLPAGSIALPTQDGGWEIVEERVILSGANLLKASATRDPATAQPVVIFELDPVGSEELARATAENIGRRLAIVLDGKVMSAPMIPEPIQGGKGWISGQFTDEQAQELALLLQAGALPAPLILLEERAE
jgi:protein-export membrane protein SecD